MNVMVASIVAGNVLQDVPWQGVSTVIVDSLDGTAGEEPHGLARSHAGKEKGKSSSERIKKEALEWVVVESSVSIGNVKTVVS